jgi:diguanylate cyclase (GGDEF)-like protein/PAS domain S-box-containing protein
VEKNVRAAAGRWRPGQLWPLAVVLGLTLTDTIVVLASPSLARTAAPLSLVIAWLDVVAVAYCFGMWPGVIAAVVTTGFDFAIVHAGNIDVIQDSGAIGSRLLLQLIVAAVIGRLRDLARRVQEQDGALAYRDRRFRALTEHAGDLIVVIDARGKPTFASASHRMVLGYEPDEIVAGNMRNVLDDTSQRRVGALVARALRGASDRGKFEVRARHADGSMRSLEISVKNCLEDDAVAGVVICGRDVTDRKRAEETLATQALRDPLTGLPNRKHLRSQIDEELAIAIHSGQPLSVLFIDLDRFKDVNDALGHHWGDALLCEVATRLKSKVRDDDLVARLGGDEFSVLLPGHGVAEATTVAERVVKALVTPYRIAGQTLVVGASIGIAVSTDDADASTILRQADIAMYVAKRNRSGVSVFSAADDREAQRRLDSATSLHDAIANDQMLLVYQPQLGLRIGAVTAVEALLRWNHPERGLLAPDDFIPLAQEIGIMSTLTEWVLRTSLRQLKRWRTLGVEARLSINLSPHDFRDARLPNTITRLLALHDVPPSQICLEIAEGTLTGEGEHAAELLGRLSALGVRISVDDFGTGYSSPALLKRCPIDELKIDESFVAGMIADPHDASMVAASIEMAHKLGLDVVAEGVEDQATWSAICKLGTDLAQGNFIVPPQPAEEIDTWLRDAPQRAFPVAELSEAMPA